MTRLDDERVAEILTGTLSLLVEVGYDDLTMDRVAERTRSSKATLHRRWGSKVGLVVGSLAHIPGNDEPFVDTGTLRGDVEAVLGRPTRCPDAAALTATLHAATRDPELSAAVRKAVVEPGRERLRAMVRRAVDRGEVVADHPALPHVVDLILTPLLLPMILDGRPASDEAVTAFYDAVLLRLLGTP